MKPLVIYRSFGAQVIAVQGDAIVIRVTHVDNDFIPRTIIHNGQTFVMEGIKWTDVLDRGENHPIFNFHNPIIGTQRADPNDNIVIMIELVEPEVSQDRFIFKYWTMAHEYAECVAKILKRKAAVEVARKATSKIPKPPVEDRNEYLFILTDGTSFFGRTDKIRDMYDRKISQTNGWPAGTWKRRSGNHGFEGCRTPIHPGINEMSESHIARMMKK